MTSRFPAMFSNRKNCGKKQSSLCALVGRLYTSSTAWASVATLLRVAGFMLVMAYALRKLPPEHIGYWYVMLTIAGFAVACEFGFAQTLGRFASYFHGGISFIPPLGLGPGPCVDGPNYPALAGLLVVARRLYAALGGVVTLVMLLCGVVWFMLGSARTVPAPMHFHVCAFLLFAIGSGMNMAAFFWPQVLFGMNRVRLTNQLVVLGLFANYLVSLGGLALGTGVAALVLGQLLLLAVPQLLSKRHVLSLIEPSAFAHPVQLVSWSNLWPITWRSGLASLASYASIQATTLLCSRVTDLERTASYGLSLQLAVLLHGFAANWITVSYPRLNEMLARGERVRTAALFCSRMTLVMVTYLVGAVIAFLFGPGVLKILGTKTSLLPASQLGALLVVVGWHLLVGMHADVLRAGNRAPHLVAFVSTAILTTGLGWWMGRTWGIPGLLGAQFAALGTLSGWWTPWRCWRELRSGISNHPSEPRNHRAGPDP
ncbi:MAG: hypothetical protein N2255_04380 [Kiritimatiellae bacterium]|nr:hypothetical protein [Kiritimatiellia bacterium]